MKSTTSTTTELAKLSGKKVPNIGKALKNAGVKKLPSGKYNTVQALDALAAGKALDRSKLQEQVDRDIARGYSDDNILIIGKKAAIRRIALQGDILELERDKAKGKLADVSEIVDRVHRRDAELAMRLTTLRESEIAKHPTHRNFIEAFCRAALEKLAEEVELGE